MNSAIQPTGAEHPLDWPHYGIGFVDAIKRAFKKYIVFSGRASRSEFWWWVLFVYVVAGVFGLLAVVITNLTSPARPGGGREIGVGGSILLIAMLLFCLAVVVPTIAITFRRLHDAGYSGWMYLLSLIPYLGGLVVLILCIQRTSPFAGKYGPPYEMAPPAGPAGGLSAPPGSPH